MHIFKPSTVVRNMVSLRTTHVRRDFDLFSKSTLLNFAPTLLYLNKETVAQKLSMLPISQKNTREKMPEIEEI